MTICGRCERPIRTGQKVRGEFIADFTELPGGVMHRVAILEEVWLEHDVCSTSREGD